MLAGRFLTCVGNPPPRWLKAAPARSHSAPPLRGGSLRRATPAPRSGRRRSSFSSDELPVRKVGYNRRAARLKASRYGCTANASHGCSASLSGERLRTDMAKTATGTRETKAQILERAEREKVKFMRLQFTDILGTIKNVEIPDRQFEEALDGKIMFDGSSIEGFVRIEESDMYLKPDLATFSVFPWAGPTGETIARLICDIYSPDGTPFAGCPPTMLQREIAM